VTLDLFSGAIFGTAKDSIWRFLKLVSEGISHDIAHRLLNAPRMFYEAATVSAEDDTSPLTELCFAVLAIVLGVWMWTSAGDWSGNLQGRAATLGAKGFGGQAQELLRIAGLYLFLQTWSPLLIAAGVLTHLGFFLDIALLRKMGAFWRLISWGPASYIFFQTPSHRVVGWMLIVFFLFSMLCYLRLSRLPTWRSGGKH